MSTGALHFHFPSKDLLAREVEAAATVSLQRLAARRDAPPGRAAGGPAGTGGAGAGLQLLVDVSRELVLGLSSDPVLRAGFGLGGDPSRKSGEGPGRWWSEWVHALLREAHGAGELAEGSPRRRPRWPWSPPPSGWLPRLPPPLPPLPASGGTVLGPAAARPRRTPAPAAGPAGHTRRRDRPRPPVAARPSP
ncbi:hypothetical protein ACFQ51_49865 [Streptomyces kaempferi]